jgi:hypothetical protein
LAADPKSECVAQRERDEGAVEGQISRTIVDLIGWVETLRALSPNPENITIRFFDSSAAPSYCRQDDYLYLGPYLFGKPSQQTISFEYKKGGAGFDYWTKHFESLWNDPNFARTDRRA